jgi:phosphoglycerol transferase MdoB-like AlkP superfamily enzyme
LPSFPQKQAVMPFLAQLRNDSLYYPYTLSYHSGGGTSDCDFAILNSVEPLRTASVFFEDRYTYPNSVVKVLRGAGYGAYAFHGNAITCWGRNRAYPRMGYSDFFDLVQMELAEQGWGAPDGAVFDFSATYTLRCKPPFFAHLITMSSHYPYNSVERYHPNELGDIPGEPLTSRHFNSMNYVDTCLRKLVTELRLRNDGYILIVGDHTPPKLNSSYLRAPKLSVGGAVLEFVPLFILGPGVKPRWEVGTVASFLDLALTLLALSGVSCTYATSGIDLSAPPAVLPPIRFDNKAYSRRELFKLCETSLP